MANYQRGPTPAQLRATIAVLSIVACAVVGGGIYSSVDWEQRRIDRINWSEHLAELNQAIDSGNGSRATELWRDFNANKPDFPGFREATERLYKTGESARQAETLPAPTRTVSKFYVKSKAKLPVAKNSEAYKEMMDCAARDDGECVRARAFFWVEPGEELNVVEPGIIKHRIRHSRSGREGYIPADLVEERP